jgi:hypothetical protein
VYADRVAETSTSTGNTDFTLAGALTGHQTFNTAFGTNVRFYYVIEEVDANKNPSGAWETGEGYLSGSTTLVRDRVDSSSTGTWVVFSAGTKKVFNAVTARMAQETITNSNFDLQNGMP